MSNVTVIPYHELILGVARCLATSNQSKNVGFVHHLNDAYACPELAVDLLRNLCA